MTPPADKVRLDWPLFLVVIVGSQGFSAFLPGDATNTAFSLSALIMAASVLPRLGPGLAVVASNPLVFLLAVFYLASALLSPRPLIALFFAGVLILMIVFFGLRRDEAERSIRTFALAATFSLVPSIVGIVAPIAPVLGGVGKGGGYAGYFPWNSSAGLCAAAALLSIALTYRALGFVWWQLPAAAAALLMLTVSKSATSLFALAASVGLFGLLVVLRKSGTQLRPLVIIAVAVTGFLLGPRAINFLSREQVADVAQRDESFSGRTRIWQWALDGISESPYIGHGTDFWQSFGEWSRSAHNGFLDVALSAGLPAALTLVAIVVLAAARLTSTMGLLLPFLAFGVVTNFALSQLTIPVIPALALWLAVGTTVRIERIRTDSVKAAGAAVSKIPGSGSAQTITARTARS